MEGPAAWLGSDLRNSDEWVYRLNEAEIAELERALASAKALGLELGDICRENFQLPTLEPVIHGWVNDLHHGRGFVLVRGFPAERYTEEENSIIYWGIGQHLGIPVSQNADGDLLGHVRDTGADPNDPAVRLYKTRERQDFHTDGSDIIGLLCLHTAKSGGASQIVSSVSVFNEVLRRRPDLVPLMFEPFYWDAHEQQRAGEKPYWVYPISRYADGLLRTFFVAWYIRNAQRHADVPRLSPKQHELIELIEEIANDPMFHLDMDFEVGDMQFLKNSVMLHARGEYEDWNDPETKRHLLRLWLAAHDIADSDPLFRAGVQEK
jgi:hypothetical protein